MGQVGFEGDLVVGLQRAEGQHLAFGEELVCSDHVGNVSREELEVEVPCTHF